MPERGLIGDRIASRLAGGVLYGQVGLEYNRALDDDKHNHQQRNNDKPKLEQRLPSWFWCSEHASPPDALRPGPGSIKCRSQSVLVTLL